MYSEEEIDARIDQYVNDVARYCLRTRRTLRVAEQDPEREAAVKFAGHVFDTWIKTGNVKIDSAIRPGFIAILEGEAIIFNSRSDHDKFFRGLGYDMSGRK